MAKVMLEKEEAYSCDSCHNPIKEEMIERNLKVTEKTKFYKSHKFQFHNEECMNKFMFPLGEKGKQNWFDCVGVNCRRCYAIFFCSLIKLFDLVSEKQRQRKQAEKNGLLKEYENTQEMIKQNVLKGKELLRKAKEKKEKDGMK